MYTLALFIYFCFNFELIYIFCLAIHSMSTFEMVCNVVVSHGERSITIPVIVDSGCQEALTLEQGDIEQLGLEQRGDDRSIQYPDGSVGPAQVYEEVTVSFTLSDGSRVEASVVPIYLIPSHPTSERAGVEGIERILGFPAMDKLNLKSDFRNRKLVKRIRRI
jgi:hypothetical protein